MTTPSTCVRCGGRLTTGVGNCGRCGAAVDAPDGPHDPAAASPASTVAGPARPWWRRGPGRWVAGAAVVVVAGLAAGAVVVFSGSSPSRPVDHTAQDAHEVAAVIDGIATSPAAAVPTAASAGWGAAAASAVPAGSTVRADESSWRPDGAGGGTIAVEVTTSSGTIRYLAVVGRDGAAWKVLWTVAATATAAPSTSKPTAVSSAASPSAAAS